MCLNALRCLSVLVHQFSLGEVCHYREAEAARREAGAARRVGGESFRPFEAGRFLFLDPTFDVSVELLTLPLTKMAG